MQREAVLSQGTLSLQQPASFFQGTLHNLQIGLALVPKKKGIFSLGKVSAKVGYLLWIMWLAGSDPPAVQNERGLPQPQKKSRRVHVPKCLYMYKHIYIQTYILHIITYSGPKVYLCCDMLRLHGPLRVSLADTPRAPFPGSDSSTHDIQQTNILNQPTVHWASGILKCRFRGFGTFGLRPPPPPLPRFRV